MVLPEERGGTIGRMRSSIAGFFSVCGCWFFDGRCTDFFDVRRSFNLRTPQIGNLLVEKIAILGDFRFYVEYKNIETIR